ncbi:MAG TPA: alpha/beta fold hydrolase [Gaiellaceae bacterium]|nr:alpha/beta fold hydrolase [Gaiellaceae bacterium]
MSPTNSQATVGQDRDRGGRTSGPNDQRSPRQEEVLLHGHRVTYRTAGDGPPVVLIHGVTGNSKQWDRVAPLLAERHTVIAPDLLGHGHSAKPRGDYSLGAYAASIRDLLIALGHRRATIVGHSLGGGVAMQFSYEYPVFCERLALVSSGGLGPEVHPLLRAATLPGSEFVLPLISHARVAAVGRRVGGVLASFGLRTGPDLSEMARGYATLSDREARQAFLHTLRAVIDPRGQRVDATDRLYLARLMPTLIVWGRRDPLIPVHHADIAHRGMPGSRLEILDDVGHFPQLADPIRFARVLTEFIETTAPAEVDFSDEYLATMRELMDRNSAPSERASPPG